MRAYSLGERLLTTLPRTKDVGLSHISFSLSADIGEMVLHRTTLLQCWHVSLQANRQTPCTSCSPQVLESKGKLSKLLRPLSPPRRRLGLLFLHLLSPLRTRRHQPLKVPSSSANHFHMCVFWPPSSCLPFTCLLLHTHTPYQCTPVSSLLLPRSPRECPE